MWKCLRRWLVVNIRIATYFAGSSFVVVWTVIRQWTNGVNFDVVGQVGVVDQWSRGLHDGAQLGATNYLLKMPIYYAVNHIDILSPHLKLLALALVFNVTTFVLLLLLFEKLLRLYGVRPNVYFYLAMIWLASITGRVYWLDYANSRNLETVGGIWVLYLGCLLLRRVTWQRALVLALAGGVVFFADQLQIYVIGGGLGLYAFLRLCKVRNRHRIIQMVAILSGLAGAVILDKLLHFAVISWLPVSFLAAPRPKTTGSLWHTGIETLHGMAVSTGRIFDASFYTPGSAPNTLREILNVVILLCVVAGIYYTWRKTRGQARSLGILCLCGILMTYAAYAASFQALQPATERYIVMVPLLLILLFGSVTPAIQKRFTGHMALLWATVLGVSAVLSLGALVVSLPVRYNKDTRLTNALVFMKQNDFTLAISSRDGIPETYFAQGTATVLPTICQTDHRLVESNLFFDRAAFKELNTYHGLVPLIVPTDGITSSASTCSVQEIQNQFGPPLKQLDVPGVGVAEVYQPDTLRLHE
ncbi:MAG TPA: hypothetical protein VMB52_01650 [Verrucomicrobiae bacterium]|nr:hypothetical protein [Verrucomicrobiae bacterium]